MANRGDFGSFVPTTQVWDVSEIYSTDVTSPAFKELLVRLYQNMNSQSLSVNAKDSGYYDTTEFVNGQLYFSNPGLTSASTTTPTMRQVFRKVFNIGSVGAGATTVAHGITITSALSFTRIYGAASLYNAVPANCHYYPIPTTNLTLVLDGTNITITNATGIVFSVAYVVLEYLKQ